MFARARSITERVATANAEEDVVFVDSEKSLVVEVVESDVGGTELLVTIAQSVNDWNRSMAAS